MLDPYAKAGTRSLDQLEQAIGPDGALSEKFSFNPSDLASDPGYAFTLAQGNKTIARANATRGNLFSTGTLKDRKSVV